MSTPNLRFGCYPIWWHMHGMKMNLEKFDPENKQVIISATAARVEITPLPDNYWLVQWQVVQSYPSDIKAWGKRSFSSNQLAEAFGLIDPKKIENGDQWLEKEYGADAARQGKFIRWEKFLNIPCPGTGHDGDPNVSIELDERIKQAVFQLVWPEE